MSNSINMNKGDKVWILTVGSKDLPLETEIIGRGRKHVFVKIMPEIPFSIENKRSYDFYGKGKSKNKEKAIGIHRILTSIDLYNEKLIHEVLFTEVSESIKGLSWNDLTIDQLSRIKEIMKENG